MYNRCSIRDTRSKPDICTEPNSQKMEGTDVPKTYSPQTGVFSFRDLSSEKKQETVKFHDQSPAFDAVLSSAEDPTRAAADDAGTHFANFFSRPVKIDEVVWGVGGSMDFLTNPWTKWMQNPRIANRLSNYKCFQGNLKLRMTINGNAFYWGSAIMSYFPYNRNSPFYYTTQTFRGDRMNGTQRNHIVVDATASQGGELSLPFFWHRDSFDLVNDNPNELGSLWLYSLTPLWHGGGSTNPIDIQIYAWCEDVKLYSPTQFNVQGLLPQAGTVDDEYADGPISKPAAIIEKVAGKMASVPGIGPWALASQVGARAVGEIAKMFGYCKPRLVTDATRVVVNNATDLATIDSLDTAVGLGFNAKREVTVDPRPTGLAGVDELSFSHLAGIESLWIDAVPWQLSDDTNKFLVSFPVNPYCISVQNRTFPVSDSVTSMVPCGFVARPFEYWRGTMRVRIQVVGNSFHKGRLICTWDQTQPLGAVETQVTRSQIVDIGDCRDFSFDIGWGAPDPYLQVPDVGIERFSIGSAFNTSNSATDNGVFSVVVLNKLVTSGATTDPVYINVWVSMEDIEVFSPVTRHISQYTPYPYDPPVAARLEEEKPMKPQVGEVNVGDVNQSDSGQPTGAPVVDSMGGDIPPHTSMFAHGDPVDSFRTALKRFTLEELMTRVQSGSWAWVTMERTCHPMIRGPIVNGIDGDAVNTNLSLYAYVSLAFAAWRGGVRYKFIPANQDSHNYTVSRKPNTAVNNGATTIANPRGLAVFTDDSWSGSTITNAAMGNTTEVEIPFYANKRFEDVYLAPAVNSISNGYAVQAIDPAQVDLHLYKYVAVADDFNLFMFRGCPQLVLWPAQLV